MGSYSNYQRPEKKYANYNDVTDNQNDKSKKATSVRSFKDMLPDWRKACAYWRQYPDMFLDHIRPPNSKIRLYFYQRMMLRVLFRHQKVYFVFTRGSAKSYTQILAMYLKCIMYPDTHLFISAPTKAQASSIAKENIERIWEHFPILQKEVRKAIFQNDYTKLIFPNGSTLDVVQVSQSSRGGRRNGGAIEEIVDENMKKDTLNEVVLPMMANNRIATCGGVDPMEKHKFQWYITTAGNRQSFAYEKMMEVLDEMVNPNSINYGNSFVMGSGFELGTMYGQLDPDFIHGLKLQPTYNPLSFSREYESNWTGTSDNSLVDLEDLQACRTLTHAEHRAVKDRNVEYVLGYDVARAEGSTNASSALVVLKLTPRGDGSYVKHLVNVYSMEGTHFLDQAIFIKRKVEEFRARMVVVDANGLGTGLIDQLVLEINEHPPYSVVNDDRYNKYKTENSVPLVFALKSSNKDTKASDIHNVFMNMVANHKFKMLHSESQARPNIKSKDSHKIAQELMPYVMTDRLSDEIMNLEYRQSGANTQVKEISRKINKDKFSALEYALFYVHLLEKKNLTRKRESADVSQFFAVKVPNFKVD